MTLDVAKIHEKSYLNSLPFRFAEVRGTPADHASWWSFDDEQVVRDRWWRPHDGQTVLDVGAAFGSYALPALALGARVVCFSPATFDTELLSYNLGLNPDLQRRCLVLRDGLYSANGFFQPDRCVFKPREQAEAGHVLGAEGWLPVRSLDSVLEERPGIGRVDWIKIDAEGAELEILRGADKCLRMYRPRILVENHEFQIKGIGEQVRDFLIGLGLGYVCEGPYPHGAVSHSFFEAR